MEKRLKLTKTVSKTVRDGAGADFLLRPDQYYGMHDCHSGSNSLALKFAKKNKSGPEWDTCVQNLKSDSTSG